MKKIIKNISYDLYLVLLVVLTFLSFIGILTPYLLPIFVVIGLISVFTKQNVLFVLPIAFFMQMSFSDLRDDVRITTFYVVILAVIIILDVIRNRKLTKMGYLFVPLVILSVLSIITGINNTEIFVTFAGWVQITTVLGLYFYFINTIEHKEENFIYISKLFMYLALLVTLEMLYYLLTSDLEIIQVIRLRTIDLGWENLNIVIYSNIVSIPLIGYLVLKSKIKVPYMLLSLASVLGILMTLSRSSIFTLGVFIVILIPLIFILEKDRMSLFIQGLIFIMFVSMALYFLEQQSIVSDYYLTLVGRDLGYFDDRLALLKIALENFKLHPIIGNGGLYSSRFLIADNGLTSINYHNTFAQASTLGILGLLGLIFLFYKKTRLVLKSQSNFKWFVLITIYVTAFVNGMLQPMYFYASYMMFIFLIIAAIEVAVDTDKSIIKPKEKS